MSNNVFMGHDKSGRAFLFGGGGLNLGRDLMTKTKKKGPENLKQLRKTGLN